MITQPAPPLSGPEAAPGVRGPGTVPLRRRTSRRRQRTTAFLCVAPALAFYMAFVVAPWLQSVWISFFDWDGIGPSTWVGMANYAEVFTDASLRASVLNAFGFIFFYTGLPLVFGLVLAALTTGVRNRGLGLVRTVLFLPQILPLVAVAVVFK
ncbi:carbohydrate ABC transporter permease [Pseudarthrobacter sp. P1]|uniref:carbohydrate ABC transporter permease n=1 Tax=Pseudarthrobacter sp. P1 TaxID=3418418 RepID=UPI003CFB2E00